MLAIETLHHLSGPVGNRDRAKEFYRGTLGLAEIDRPPFAFGGAWYRVGDRTLHLIVPRIYTLDPDRHIIEINAAKAD